jgi:hypothetical protein
MSLDIYLEELLVTSVFCANYTHNVVDMAEAAGIYKHVWRPEELGIAKARKKGEEEGHEKPGIRLVNKVLKLNQKASVLNGDFLKGVAWVLGDIGPRSVAGLSDLIREAKGEKE